MYLCAIRTENEDYRKSRLSRDLANTSKGSHGLYTEREFSKACKYKIMHPTAQYTEKQACARRSNTACQHGAVAGVFGVLRGLADYPAIRSQQHSWTALSSEPGLFENFMLTCS